MSYIFQIVGKIFRIGGIVSMYYFLTRAFCLVLCFAHIDLYAKYLDVSINAESAILINADTGKILYEKNSHVLQFPASITKVASALYALKMKEDKLSDLVAAGPDAIASVTEAAIRRSNYKLPSHYVEQGSSHIGIKKGEELKFSDLIYGMMLPSANDASNVVAQFVSGSIPEFVKDLNFYLKSIGCKDTHFCNPHGLHHPEHVTTAFDMALIAKEALKNPFFSKVVKTVRFTRPKTNKQESTTLVQLNKLLRTGRYQYKKAIGIKTGNTSFALNTFVTAAEHDGRTLILVMLKTKERNDIFTDAIHVFDAAFNEAKVERVLIKAGVQDFVLNLEGAKALIQTSALNDLIIEYYPSEEPEIKSFLQWDAVKLPVVKGQRVGEITVSNESTKSIQKVILYAENDVTLSFWHWF